MGVEVASVDSASAAAALGLPGSVRGAAIVGVRVRTTMGERTVQVRLGTRPPA